MSVMGADVDGFLSRVRVAIAGMKEGIDEINRREGKRMSADKTIGEILKLKT